MLIVDHRVQRLDKRAYPPRIQVDLDDLADMLSASPMAKVVHDPKVLSRQVLLYREFVRLVFQGV